MSEYGENAKFLIIIVAALKDVPGIEFMPEADYGRCNRWLTVILITPESLVLIERQLDWPWKKKTLSHDRSGNQCTCSRCSKVLSAEC